MRIRWRLAFFGALVVAVAMLAFGVLINLLAQRAAPNEQDKNLVELVELFAADLEDATLESLAAADSPVQIDVATVTDPFVMVADEAGAVIYSTGRVAGESITIPAAVIVETLERGVSQAVYSPAAGVEINIQARPLRGADPGVVAAGQSTAAVDEQLEGLSALFWLVGIIMTLAAVMISWVVAGRALRPLRRLATTTEEIRETGDLSRRLPPAKNRKDEVGVLTASFNGMLDGLQSTRHELSDALEAQRRFVADASHELRSPLTTIRNNAEFLAERPDAAAADRADALADVVSEGQRMNRLVDDLLVLASLDSGREVEHVPIDLASLAHDVARKRRGVSVAAEAPAVISGDASAIVRLLVILLDNATKYGGGEADLSVAAGDGAVTLTVGDNGPGLDSTDLGRLFDRFYRVDPSRTTAGFGLGLAIAKEIVAAHGAKISAGNRPEGGALFTVSFPPG